jgi:hypothetical protein
MANRSSHAVTHYSQLRHRSRQKYKLGIHDCATEILAVPKQILHDEPAFFLENVEALAGPAPIRAENVVR